MDLSIIIVNYNGGLLVDSCIESIFNNQPDGEFEIIFIDNASTDGSFQRIQEKFPQLVYIDQGHNYGLARSFNAGLAVAKGKYLLSLDNDTRVLPGALQLLIDHLAANPQVGAAGSQLLNPDMTPQRTFRLKPSALNAIFGRRSLVTRLWPSNPVSRRYLMTDMEHSEEPFEVDWVSTAALMIPRTAYEKAGGLDEDFFVYWVDAEWCDRIKKSGFSISAVPASKVIHDENLKAQRRTPKNRRMVIDFHRGAYLYYRKNNALSAYNPMALFAFAGLSSRAALLIFWDNLRCWMLSKTA